MGDPDRDDATVRGGSPRPTAETVSERPAGAQALAGRKDAPVASAFDPPADRFEATGELGRGGMGRVDDAFDRALGRPVAIKHMLSTSDVELARFEREARITARLEHPGIVPIHDAGRGADGTPYYVMRRVDGQPLSDLVGGKSLAGRLALIPNVLAACDATAFAHARGIIHRDIKPTNILVGPFGETLVIDWGLAREITERDGASAAIPVSDPTLTRAGTVAGTPGFMAPEQARGEAVDARADVYALGATLFYVVTGELPYGRASATEMVDLVGAGRPPDWKLVPAAVPADLRAILEKSMAREAGVRYRDAGELAGDLRRFVTGNLVGAYEYGRVARLVRFVRRHRAAVAVGGVSVVVLAVVATLSIGRVVAERDAATAARATAELRQHDTAVMADRLLVDHARELLERDPTAALQELRRLPPDSELWAQAASVAQGAALRGIPFGFAGAIADRIAVSPDSSRVLVVGLTDRQVRVIELATHTRRVVGDLADVNTFAWLDRGRRAAFASGHQLIELDTETGRQRTRELTFVPLHMSTDEHGVIWLATDTALFELATFDAEPTQLAAAEASELAPGLAAYALGADGVLRAVTRKGSWELARYGAARPSFLTLESGVVAFGATPGAVEAWKLVEGVPEKLGAWTAPASILAAAIVGDRVLVTTRNGLFELTTSTNMPLSGRFAVSLAAAPGSDRLVAASGDGALLVIDHGALWSTGARHVQLQRVQLTADGRHVVGVTGGGALLIWDLASFAPEVRPVAAAERLFGVTAREAWLTAVPSEIRARDRVTWTPRTIVEDDRNRTVVGGWIDHTGKMLTAMFIRSGVAAGAVPVVIDPATGAELASLRDAPDDAYSATEGRLVVGQPSGRVFEWTIAPTFAEHELATLSGPVRVVSYEEPFVAGGLSHGVLERIDRRTQAHVRATLPGEVDDLLVEASGVLWAQVDGGLWRWDGHGPPTAVDVPGRVLQLLPSIAGPLAITQSAVVVLPPHRVIVRASDAGDLATLMFGVSATSPWFAGVGTRQQIQLADLTTGVAFDLPAGVGASGLVVGDRDLFVQVAGTQTFLLRWALDVPREPAALQRWLATVTNARPPSDSEAVTWP